MDDMDLHLNPTMSASTMNTLGLQEGSVDRLLKVDIKYLGTARDFLYVLRIANIPNAQFAVDEDGTKEKSRKNSFKACMAFLMIAYIDALETTDLMVDMHGTRICCWDNKSVASAILQDTKPDGSFGLLPLKKTFRKNKVLMLSTPSRIESFVRANMPSNSREEEMEKYRIATRQMYGEIDDAISKFLKNVGTNTKSTVPVTVKKVKSKTQLHHGQNNGASTSKLIKRHRHQQIVHHSGSSEECDTSDGDYFEDFQTENISDQEETSLDEASFDCIPSEDDDFMSASNNMPTIHTVHVLQDVVASSLVEVSVLQTENNSPRSISRSRPITISMSPLKPVLPTKQATSPLTRSITSANPELLLMQGISDSKKQPTSAASSSKQITPTATSPARRSRLGKSEVTPSPKGKKNINLVQDSMSRKLVFGSREWVPGEAPSFDLGFDDPKEAEQPTFKVDPTTGFPVITSSNEEEFYGPAEDYEILAAQAGEKYFPSAIVSDTCSSGTSVNALPPHPSVDEDHVVAVQSSTTPVSKVKNNEGTRLPDAHVSDSKTPVPQAHQKRILKPGITQRSPFVTNAKSTAPNIPKDTVGIYNAICQHGSKSESHLKKEVIIDYGSQFVYLPDLADSVESRGWISNSTCEIGLHILSQEMVSDKKIGMQLVISIMFPVLQNLSTVKDLFIGHYYLINLNLKAERFEIMDSLRKASDKALKSDSSKIIKSIEEIWSSNYKMSNIKIENFETIHIPVPKQITK
ncbi:hypothetical protein ACQ4PT_044520 [Festuca glaucescens]